MAITITVEDGTVVTGANSFQSVAATTAYALNRGIVLPAAVDTVAAWLIRSGDWLNSFRDRYKGTRVSSVQAMQWPRDDVEIQGVILPYTQLPTELIAAQNQLVMALFVGVDIDGAIVGGELPLKRRKTDVLEKEWFSPSEVNAAGLSWRDNVMPAVDANLAVLFKPVPGLRTVRI